MREIEETVVRGSMTKAALVEEVARVTDLTKKDAEVIVDTVFRCIIDALHRGEKIELRGFGSFRLRQREPRKGRNPKTGDRVDVPPKKVPYFKPGKDLKDLINRGSDESRAAAGRGAAGAEGGGGVRPPARRARRNRRSPSRRAGPGLTAHAPPRQNACRESAAQNGADSWRMPATWNDSGRRGGWST